MEDQTPEDAAIAAMERANIIDQARAPRVQKVNLSARGEVVIPEDDERVANLVRIGLTVVEAREAVRAVGTAG